MPRTPWHLQGMAAKNPPSAEYKKEVFKYIPIMRQYGLDAAADHLQDWVTGQVALAPLLDVTACLDCTSTIGFPMVASPFFAVFSHRQFDPVFRWDDFSLITCPMLAWNLRCALKTHHLGGVAPQLPQSLEPEPAVLG